VANDLDLMNERKKTLKFGHVFSLPMFPHMCLLTSLLVPQFMLKTVNTREVSATFVCRNYPYTSEIPENRVEYLTGPEFGKHWYRPI
jgi:hypothetical protein